ncbi:bifunctional ornithine acetyltransferase/N-acetylglutamate synthase [Gammaproteobacteria bacterium 45_16_T64]|nr:bifunctional ornithine acetyltransferase/N-acetylglutamate synthase [Gammaproteobacteria bacterium 45_16_T64]
MAVGPAIFPEMLPIKGFRLGTTSAEIKYKERKDLVVMEVTEGAVIAGVFTLNRFCAAPVQICKKHLASFATSTAAKRYLVTNTGYANAGTGPDGYQNSLAVCERLATIKGVPVENVLPYSTGVIGEPLPVTIINGGLDRCLDTLSETGWVDAASGIMTTDTRPKGASVALDINGNSVSITGISKGSGMIMPNMATMLAYVATDVGLSQSLAQALLKEAADKSFNQATVDGDTSTNDSCMLIATGVSAVTFETSMDAGYAEFKAAFIAVCVELAQAIIRDGEGATKFVTVRVEQAESRAEARDVAYTVAHSPLVKTALFAADPNWGRILAAIGRAPINDLDVDKVSVFLDNVLLAEQGGVARSYKEDDGARIMAQEEFSIVIRLGRGDVAADVWTCDFSYDYVKINADYRS